MLQAAAAVHGGVDTFDCSQGRIGPSSMTM